VFCQYNQALLIKELTMRYWETLAELDRDGFRIIVDKTWEDTDPSDVFDDGPGWGFDSIADLCRKIDQHLFDWFCLRVRVMCEDVELGSNYLGCCLYEDARDVLTDGTVEDSIEEAMQEVRGRLTTLAQKFTMLAIKHA
jgi:hypothetical protein